MATNNPLADTAPSTKSVSSKTFCIAGIQTDVFGLDEISPATKSISCLWLLHPRLQTKEIMASVADSCINDWNQRPAAERTVGLIAVAFDQRNHGGRKVHALANESCKSYGRSYAHPRDRLTWPLTLSNTSNEQSTNIVVRERRKQNSCSRHVQVRLPKSLLSFFSY